MIGRPGSATGFLGVTIAGPGSGLGGLRLKPPSRAKFRADEPPIHTADRLRSVEFPYGSRPREKEGKIAAQIPANWLILPRPYDDDIQTRLAVFMAEQGIRSEGGLHQLLVRYTAPSGRTSKRGWRLLSRSAIVRLTCCINSRMRSPDRLGGANCGEQVPGCRREGSDVRPERQQEAHQIEAGDGSIGRPHPKGGEQSRPGERANRSGGIRRCA